jgi:shikimate dehydrogenase
VSHQLPQRPHLDRYAVLGNPVAHSQSPYIHAAFARQTGQPIEYTRVLCAMDGFVQAVRDFAASGARGCNVTAPFKFQSAALARAVTPRAALADAANVLRFDADGWLADNTDGIGLVRDIEVNADHRLRGQRVLLIGAGGAAAGVLGPLIEARPAQLRVANRSAERAAALAQRHAALAADHGVALSSSGLDGTGSAYDVVLNSSASSLGGADVPVGDEVLQRGTLAVDLMYGGAARRFTEWARLLGATPRDGLGMLVEQAAEAFFVWRGVMPDTAPVLRSLRELLDAPAPAR